MIDWNEAPEWANYVAMDSTGEWYWFENKPHCLSSLWLGGGRNQLVVHMDDNWRQTLQERPAK